MKKKVTFGTDPEKRSKLEDHAKQKNMNLTDVLNYILDCHFEKVESLGDSENALKRIEDKLDLLLLQDSKPKKTAKNKGKYQEIVKCIKDNAQDIGAVPLIELMDIIPELKTINK
ncbi:hypothetical protein MHK_003443 [Candidatus Magnetomorum sp. HK-1]|nr:hypothetical protein MHK_003443 [Candidatus Magnetomorum sp. HK-1]